MHLEDRLELSLLDGEEEADLCARLMATSEPWITLKRSYEAARTMLADPAREVHVARVAGAFVGFAVLRMDGPFRGYVQTLAIVEGRRGQGWGARLLARVEDRIFRESPNVFLCVSSFNGRARRLYERLGYELVGPLKDYLVRGHDEILLRKSRGPLSEFGGG